MIHSLFLNDELKHQTGVDYHTLSAVIKVVALKVVGSRPEDDLIEDLMSEGWIGVLEELENFDPTRGVKATTYLWDRLYGRLYRHMRELRRMVTGGGYGRRSTENCVEGSMFEANPYEQTPERVCEFCDNVSMWEKIKHEHRQVISVYMKRTPSNSDERARKQISRTRRRCVMSIREAMDLKIG